MTTATASTAPTTRPATASEPPARFQDLLAAEWIKLWSLRSTAWALGLSALAVIGINVNAAYADYSNYPSYGPDILREFVPYWAMNDAFNRNAALVLMLAAGSVGALTIVGEYSTGLIRTTFAAVPARRPVMAAKVTVVTVVMLGYGAVVGFGSFFASQAILAGRHANLTISDTGVWRAIVAGVILAPVCALTGLGIGAIVRHSPTTIVTTTVVLLMLPILVNSNHRQWVIDMHNALPYVAWERLVELDQFPQRPTLTGSWIVLAAWAVLAAIVAIVVVDRRDL